jgi:hypothetical protein
MNQALYAHMNNKRKMKKKKKEENANNMPMLFREIEVIAGIKRG